ncbi:MAG: T9SS type A sorting domain-containing protein [Flavobacteriales bacterium]|nr:T9SS type A sorting domain-containing protein [Flavobacteriales bacterium]MCB9167810.1 T9SS type A sorting domain-containing protein [Flavobacteriales bacterium]
MKIATTILSVLFAATTTAQSLTDSLIAHFPLDGNGVDTIGGLVPIIIQGAPFDTTDRFGNSGGALWFDGASYLSYGDVLDMDTSAFSLSFWIMVDTVHERFDIGGNYWDEGSLAIGKGTTIAGTPEASGYSVALRQPVPGEFIIRGTTGDSNSQTVGLVEGIQLDQWRHVVLSRCGTLHEMYLDGSLVEDSTSSSVRDLNTNIFFTLGAMNRDPTPEPDTEYFTGALDDVRIYKGRCLSSSEIVALACTGTMMSIDTASCDPIMIGDTLFTTSTMVMETLVSLGGCDSTVIHNITIVQLDTTVLFDQGTLFALQDSVSYQWIDCGTGLPIAGETGQSFTPGTDGSYAVELDNGTCTALSACVLVTGMREHVRYAIAIRPNPSDGTFTINLPPELAGVELRITDVTGQERQRLRAVRGPRWIVLDVAPGVYFLRTTDGGAIGRILIVR